MNARYLDIRLMRGLTVFLLVGAAAACAGSPAPVPVVAEPSDMALLAGEWRGEYESPAVGRSGSILFNLEAGADTAYGDVVMIPRGWDRPLGPAIDPAAPDAEVAMPEVLTIRFVRVEGGNVSGILVPYQDPECGCPIQTTFTGQLERDRIEGTFISRRAGGAVFSGTWKAVRKRD